MNGDYMAQHRALQTDPECLHRKRQRQPAGRMAFVIGTWLSGLNDHVLAPAGVMLLPVVPTWARSIMVVEGEMYHVERRACAFAAQTLLSPSPYPRP